MSRPTIRCAVYTRKSSDEGLDQAFNSLDAQHEACAAYVSSQRHEGWKLVKTRYDDGGLSGGSLERPALQRLMADIDAGRVGMVVVYKIDRLTRSLADFAKLVERLEAADCSFVSVTQAFNTSSSMGRLTLNVLLSFAQFEREVTAERIRDKIAASKKKGLWMGGVPPLGYDAHPDPTRRELVVNEPEATRVRQLFDLYDQLSCLNAVVQEAERLGLRSKRHQFATGRVQGGGSFSRGQVYHLLRNPVYLGQIRHKEKLWPGAHPAIVDQELWDRVQGKLQEASGRRRGTKSAPSLSGRTFTDAAPLTGRFRDETGDRLTPTHTQRHGRRVRYYISNRLISGGTDPTGWRLPAPAFEAAIAKSLADHLAKAARQHAVLETPDASVASSAADAASKLAEQVRGIDAAAPLIASGEIGRDTLRMELNRDALAEALKFRSGDLNPALLQVEVPFTCRRRGVETRIVAGDPVPVADAPLLRALRQAHRWSDALRSGKRLAELATQAGHSPRYLARIISLSYLSPRIQKAILEGRQPAALTLETLVRFDLPLDWSDQERQLGFSGDAPPGVPSSSVSARP